jgi:hypothetical protein
MITEAANGNFFGTGNPNIGRKVGVDAVAVMTRPKFVLGCKWYIEMEDRPCRSFETDTRCPRGAGF